MDNWFSTPSQPRRSHQGNKCVSFVILSCSYQQKVQPGTIDVDKSYKAVHNVKVKLWTLITLVHITMSP